MPAQAAVLSTKHSAADEPAIDRGRFYFWLFLIATSNKLVGMVILSVTSSGWSYSAFNLFGISAILWVAFAAGLALLLQEVERDPIRRGDVAVGVCVAGAAIAPFSSVSAAALALAALYAMRSSTPGSRLHRAAIIFLAMTGSLIWGPLLLTFLTRPLLGVDAFFVAHLVGSVQTGNQVSFTDGSSAFVIAPGCSSFHGMSLALVFWATVNQWFKVPFTWAAALWAVAAIAATFVVNVARIGAIAHFPAHFIALHVGWGAQLASWTTLLLVVVICLYGARRAVFATH